MSETTIAAVGVIGLGAMGSGIAEVVARAGISVRAIETNREALTQGLGRLSASLNRAVQRNNLDPVEAIRIKANVTGSTTLDDLADCDLIIEAATENEAAKMSIFRAVDNIVSEDAILASNTSSIPITSLAATLADPGRMVGVHFFNPVPAMSLVEIVSASQTAPHVVRCIKSFVQNVLNKTPVDAPDRAGFIVNALLVPYILSAIRMKEHNIATAEDIDRGMQLGCGHPMGPLALADFIGLDVIEAAADSMWHEYREPQYACPPLLRRLVAAGRLGKKSGSGIYDDE